MTFTREQIKAAALALDPVERESLAEELLLSINDEERTAIDADWLKEAHRRDAAFHAGKTSVRPVSDLLKRLSGKATE